MRIPIPLIIAQISPLHIFIDGEVSVISEVKFLRIMDENLLDKVKSEART